MSGRVAIPRFATLTPLLALATVGLTACPPVVLLGLINSASTPFYARGTALRALTGRRIGRCIEVMVEPEPASDTPPLGVPIRWTFGNVCDAPLPFDLSAVRAWSEDLSGRRRDVAPYDPGAVLRPQHIDALIGGYEVVYYSESDAPSAAPIEALRVRLCFDASALTPRAANEPPPPPMCVPLDGRAIQDRPS